MPYSFTEIEKDKSQTIRYVFAFLILFYFVSIWVLALIVINFVSYQQNPYTTFGTQSYHFIWPTFLQIFQILLVSLVVAVGHWFISISNLINKLLKVLNARALDAQDTYHQRFQNLLEEVSVATGGRSFEGVVIPVMAMNAFALEDFKGRAVIGVTEGLLARLSRAQLETVIGHEAAHIVSGDCLATTITSSLFELINGVLKGFELMFSSTSSRRTRYRSSGRGGGGAVILLMLIYVAMVIIRFVGQLLRMFISRQREFRADAIAVRLTRDPLSLAEALYAMGFYWRGSGLTLQEMAPIFFINPKPSLSDEREGFMSNLFSTHPPMERRLDVLLSLAHADVATMVKNIEAQTNRPRHILADDVEVLEEARWMAHHEGAWQGPFDMAQLCGLSWLGSHTWTQRLGGERKVQPAYKDQCVREGLEARLSSKGGHQCPRCSVSLQELSYEGTTIEQCPMCRGVLVHKNNVQKIILRHEIGFSERIKRMAKVLKEQQIGARMNVGGSEFFKKKVMPSLWPCPQCAPQGRVLLRGFYTAAYPIEIDRCLACGFIWFDHDELEVLQCMIEESHE